MSRLQFENGFVREEGPADDKRKGMRSMLPCCCWGCKSSPPNNQGSTFYPILYVQNCIRRGNVVGARKQLCNVLTKQHSWNFAPKQRKRVLYTMLWQLFLVCIILVRCRENSTRATYTHCSGDRTRSRRAYRQNYWTRRFSSSQTPVTEKPQ